MNKKLKRKGSGFRTVVALFLIVVGASTLLTNGIFPKLTDSVPPNPGQANIPVVNGSPDKNNSLQLKTFGFKTPSPAPQNCTQTLAVDFLVDKSGSMGYGSKMAELKKGLILFTGALTDNSVIGMQSFSDTPNDVIPFSYYKTVKMQVTNAINSMQPNSWTYTKDAFVFTKQKLDTGTPKYPGYKFALIFISDGVPEIPNNPAGGRFAPSQDPTDIATQIKQEGIRIFTIAYVDNSDASVNSQLQAMMKRVASSPTDYYMAPDPAKVSSILSHITTKLCQ